MKELVMPVNIMLVYLSLLTASPLFGSSILPLCNEMENIQMKCVARNGKVYGSRVKYCKQFPREPGCSYINKSYSNQI
jgi:hypothetical protein